MYLSEADVRAPVENPRLLGATLKCESNQQSAHSEPLRYVRTCTKCHQIVLGARGYETNAANSLSS